MTGNIIDITKWKIDYNGPRYSIYRKDKWHILKIDKTENLEKFVNERIEETNKRLTNAELYDANLIFRTPFTIGAKKYFNGYVSMHIRYNIEEPNFLNEQDQRKFWLTIKEIAKDKFGFDTIISPNLNYKSINFEEENEEDLYKLTAKKESIIKKGFENIVRFTKWYSSALASYNSVIESHSKEFENCIENLCIK